MTRVGSHRVFSAVLMPLGTCPWPIPLAAVSPNIYDPRVKYVKSGFFFFFLEGMRDSGYHNVNEDIKLPKGYAPGSESDCMKLFPPCTVSEGAVSAESYKEVCYAEPKHACDDLNLSPH